MPGLREQAKNCIEKVRFSLIMPPVRGDTQGGKVVCTTGGGLFHTRGKGEKTDPKAQGRGNRLLTVAAPLFLRYAWYVDR